MNKIKAGDLVRTIKEYANTPKGSVGIVTANHSGLCNVTFPQGSWAFASSELELLMEAE